MIVKYQWKRCPEFNDITAYFIEIAKDEISPDLLKRLSNKDKAILKNDEYIKSVNDWAKKNPTLASKECIYILASEDGKHIKLEMPEFPYSGQWNAYNPFIEVSYKINTLDQLVEYSIKITIQKYLQSRSELIEIGKMYPDLLGGNDNMIGRIGEYIALKFLKKIGQNPKKVIGSSNPGFDLIDGNIMTQVKCITKENINGKTVRLTKPWNQFLLIELDNDYIPERVGIINNEQFNYAIKENNTWSQNPIVKLTMLSGKGLIGKYGKVYKKEEIDI